MIYAKPSTALTVVFRAYLASDHVTPATGKTIAITISKNGGAFGNPNAGATNATEISSGFYKVTLDTTDTGTAGPLAVRGAVATVDDVGAIFYVGQSPADVTHWLGTAAATPTVAGVPEVDITHIGGTAVTAAAGIPEVKVASIAANAITAASMAADAGAEVASAVRTELTTELGRIDAAVTTRLAPTTAGRTLDVSAGGEAGIDFANIGSPTTVVNLSGTTIKTATDVEADTADIQTRIPAALTGAGNIKADALAFGGATVTATTSVTIPASSTLATTTGAVGSVTGNVGGNVTGSVGSVAAGGITAASIATDAIDADAIAADAGTELGTAVWATAARTLTAATNITSTGGTTVPQTGDAYARLGAPAGASVSADIAAVQADLPTRITKNTALAGFVFPMYDSADHVTPKTGLTITAQRSLDGAALASCANSATEISNGLYKIDLAAGDLNGNTVTLRFTATGADATIITLATQPT